MRVAFAIVVPLAALALAVTSARPASGAGADGVIDTSYVSHVGWQDRRPLCPVDQEAFDVRLYALAGDLTGVRVRFLDGTGSWVEAARTGVRGALDVWQARVPAATTTQARYYFEIADGGTKTYLGPSGCSASPPADSGWVVDFATLAHAPLGATLVDGGGTVFRVWAPGATTAAVRGEFNAWGITPMTRLGEDFVARVPNATVDQQYKYYFTPEHWSPDARGRVLDPASYLWNSRIADPTTFTWTDSAWQPPPPGRMVVYQLNVGTFSGLNDPNGPTSFPARFADVAARAAELRALGVNAVLFNPVTSTPSLTYAGYSTLDPWSPEWSYGMPDDFKAVVDALHHEGIAVLCDIVWSHVDPNTALLWNYDGTQAYFETPAAQTPWGPQAAFGRAGVDDYYVDSALHWIGEYHVDGFRMDAAGVMAQDPHAEAGWALMQRFNDEVRRRRPGVVTISESFPVQGSVVMPTSLGGAGFTSTYNGDYRYQVLYALPNNLGYSYYGYLGPVLSVWPGLTTGHQALNYIELHDDAWGPNGHRMILDLAPTPGAVGDTARARLEVALGVLMLTPGVPAMLMGDEWAETTAWGTTAANRIDWGLRVANAGFYDYVRELVGLRTRTPALEADSPSVPTHWNDADGVFGWLRYDDVGRLFLIVANLGDVDYPSYLIGAPHPGAWIERLNSQAARYGGTGLVNDAPLVAFERPQDGYPRTLDLRLPRSSVLVLQATETLDAPPVAELGPLRIAGVWPNPARGAVRVDCVLPRPGLADLSVFDAQGRRVASLLRGTFEAGPRSVAWDGRDATGRRAAAGLYFVRLQTADGTATKRVALVW